METFTILHSLAQATIIKHHRPNDFNNSNWLSHSLEVRKSKIKVPANSVLMKALFLAYRWLSSVCVITWQKESSLSGVSSYKDSNPTGSGLPLWPHPTLITSLEVIQEVRLQHMNLEGNKYSVHNTQCSWLKSSIT